MCQNMPNNDSCWTVVPVCIMCRANTVTITNNTSSSSSTTQRQVCCDCLTVTTNMPASIQSSSSSQSSPLSSSSLLYSSSLFPSISLSSPSSLLSSYLKSAHKAFSKPSSLSSSSSSSSSSKCHQKSANHLLLPTIPVVLSTMFRILLLTLALSTSQVNADGMFELRLDGFSNKLNRDSAGNCCSPGSSTTNATQQFCVDKCSTFFRVCLKNYQANVDNSNPTCLYGEKITPVLELRSDYVVQFPFEFSWPGTFSLVIEAWNNATHNQKGLSATPVNRQIKGQQPTSRSLIARSFESRPIRLRIDPQWTTKVQLLNDSTLRYSYRVLCKPHYYGETCTKLCTSRNTTLSHYGCDKNGNRVCHPGWSGEWCDKPVCKSCTNGECVAPDQCRCRLGWTGPSCDQCLTYPNCANGFCNKPFECICKEGWGGLLCNKDLNYCTNHRPCKNDGVCSNSGEGLFTCSCPPGFAGTRCEIRVDICEPSNSPCKNSGVCKPNGASNYTCECPAGFGGRNCEKPISQCNESKPCHNDGRCIDQPNGTYQCACKHGFSGPKCEQRQRSCQPKNPCLNGGSCSNNSTVGSYTCKCKPGFAGDHCELNVNDCESSPCLNSGTCVDEINNFRCLCPIGFTGELCQINVDDCLLSPCANGGTCLDGANDFICLCPSGFTGKDCSIDINECSSSPCMNGGECRDRINDYECLCDGAHYGPRCEFFNATLAANLQLQQQQQQNTLFASLFSDSPATFGLYSIGGIVLFVLLMFIVKTCRRCQIRGRKINSKIAEEEARRQNEHNSVMSGLNNTASQRSNSNFGSHPAKCLATCLNPTAANVIVNSLGEKSASLHHLARQNGPYKLTNEYVYHEQQQNRNHYSSNAQFYQTIDPQLNTKAATLGKSFKNQSSKELGLKVSLDDSIYSSGQQHTYEDIQKPSNLLAVNISPNSSQYSQQYQQANPIYESPLKQSNLQNNLQIAASLQSSRHMIPHYMIENLYSHPVYADPKKLHATEV